MAIKPIQQNNISQASSYETKKSKKPYLEANERVTTPDNVKPLPGQGHLVHDTAVTAPVFFVKDIAYDMKSVNNGIKGTANDHQLGRLNDVGLRMAGIAIATYLASKTHSTKAKIMEFVGLAAFLASMDLYPRLAIYGPAKIVHGFNVGKQYIDDQGRKKSVFQDSNYIPYDLYRGDRKDEDLDIIGDRMGIPRDIKNRHDIIKEQMRKIATQNNTLWMLTAGIATPAMAALACRALETPINNAVIDHKNKKANEMIKDVFSSLKATAENINQTTESELSRSVSEILKNSENKQLSSDELEKLLDTLTKDLNTDLATSIRSDITSVIGKETCYTFNNDTINILISNAKKSAKGRCDMSSVIPTKADITQALKAVLPDANVDTGVKLNEEGLSNFKSKLSEILGNKISATNERGRDFLSAAKENVLSSINSSIAVEENAILTGDKIEKLNSFAKALGEFKAKQSILDKCSFIKFEANGETVLADAYQKFEKTFFKELGFSKKELKLLRNADEKTVADIMERRFTALASNEEQYNKSMQKLADIISQMEIRLHGHSETSSSVADLITAIEENHNILARRLHGLNNFESTAKAISGGDLSTRLDISSSNSREDVMKILDGIYEKAVGGKGSAKKNSIDRICIDRYAGARNSMYRMLHTLDIFKKTQNSGDIVNALRAEGMSENDIEEFVKIARKTIFGANSSEHTQKLHITSDDLYKKVMTTLFDSSAANEEHILGNGNMSKVTEDLFKSTNKVENGKILSRFQQYVQRFRDIISNNGIDFTKPMHNLGNNTAGYEESSKTILSVFNLVGKSPVDFIKEGADKIYPAKKWLAIISTITASVFGVAFLSQFAFGKISNPNTLIKQETENEAK